MRTTGTCTGPSLDSIYGLAMQEHPTSKASKEHCFVSRVLHTCLTLNCCLVNVFSSPLIEQLLMNTIRIWAQGLDQGTGPEDTFRSLMQYAGK